MATVRGLWGVKLWGSQFLAQTAAQTYGDTWLQLSELKEIGHEHGYGV